MGISAQMTSKRGAAEAAGPSDGPKRQRIDVSDGTDVATEVGLKFISQLKVSKDKTGRDIAPPFFTLPPRSLDEYYRVIKLPMAIDTVEEKLNRREYQSISAVESDLKRMVKNAKDFNDRNSSIFADAERIRKLLSNFMVKHNPAYNDPNYVAVATSAPGENEEAEQNAIRAMVNTRRQFKSMKEGKSPAANMDIETAGDSSQEKFQNAQEGIINELLDHQDDDGYHIYNDFVNLPPRGLKAYYATIEQPMCLKAVQKKIKGQEGRKQGAGTSIYKSWDELEDDISLIWRNARQFNEDGSALFVLAGEFEEHFRRLLAEAKEAVPELYQGNGEASAPRIKLNMKTQDSTQKLKLRFGGQKSDRQSSDEAQVIVDNDSLRRQREHVNAGANGRGISGVETSAARAGTRNPFGGSSSSSGPTILPNIGHLGQERNRSTSAASPALSASAIKPEVPRGQTPLLSAIETGKDSQASDEAASGSSFAATAPHMPPPASGALRFSANSFPPQPHLQYQPAQHRKTTPFENHHRPPGKDASSALILSTTISTHPDLDTKGDPHYSHTFPADDVLSQQSFNFHLPATSYFLRIIPTIGPLPLGWDSKLVVQLDFAPQTPKFYDAEQRPVFDIRLYPHDLHTIIVERLAGPSRGAPKSGHPPVQDMEYEKLTLHVNLLKH